MSTVLVTGGSGFIAGHTIMQLLTAGHQVHTTVRNPNRADAVRAMVGEPGDRLSFFAADLNHDVGWREAATGCDYVLHVASPFPAGAPAHEDELIVPARDGALRVLRAAKEAGAKRVVLTSSFAAIGYGHVNRATPFDEYDWTNLGAKKLSAYVKSKTIAEHAAWDFVAAEGGPELSVVNPVGVFGPVFGSDFSTSTGFIKTMLDGAMPAVPRLYFGAVDVRDVAELHIRAMTHPDAKGERFLAVAGDFISALNMAKILRARLGEAAVRTPKRQLPDWLVRLLALGDARLRQIVPELGKAKNATNEKARRVLGWGPRSAEEAIAATGESLLRLGLVKAA